MESIKEKGDEDIQSGKSGKKDIGVEIFWISEKSLGPQTEHMPYANNAFTR